MNRLRLTQDISFSSMHLSLKHVETKQSGKYLKLMQNATQVYILTEKDPFQILLDDDHPLRWAFRLEVVSSSCGFPLPSLGLVLAMVSTYAVPFFGCCIRFSWIFPKEALYLACLPWIVMIWIMDRSNYCIHPANYQIYVGCFPHFLQMRSKKTLTDWPCVTIFTMLGTWHYTTVLLGGSDFGQGTPQNQSTSKFCSGKTFLQADMQTRQIQQKSWTISFVASYAQQVSHGFAWQMLLNTVKLPVWIVRIWLGSPFKKAEGRGTGLFFTNCGDMHCIPPKSTTFLWIATKEQAALLGWLLVLSSWLLPVTMPYMFTGNQSSGNKWWRLEIQVREVAPTAHLLGWDFGSRQLVANLNHSHAQLNPGHWFQEQMELFTFTVEGRQLPFNSWPFFVF